MKKKHDSGKLEHRGRISEVIRENFEMRIDNLKRIYEDEFKSLRDEITVKRS